MFTKKATGGSNKDELVRRAAEEREKRQSEKSRNLAAVKIERWMRNVTGRRAILKKLRAEVDECVANPPRPATELFLAGQKLLFVYQPNIDAQRLDAFCQAVLVGMETQELKHWYVTVSLNKQYAVDWIKQVKSVLLMVCKRLTTLKPGQPRDDPSVTTCLNMILVLTDYTLWKFTARAGDAMKPTLHKLCVSFVNHLVDNGLFPMLNEVLMTGLGRPEPGLNKQTLAAATGIRPLALCQFSPAMMSLFIKYILTVPGTILHLNVLCPETTGQLEKVEFLPRVLSILCSQADILSSINGTSALCVLGNIVQLSTLHMKLLQEKKMVDQFVASVTLLLPLCHEAQSTSSQSTKSSWHFMFGWCKDTVDRRIQDSHPHIRRQLQFLWHRTLVETVFAPVLALTPAPVKDPAPSNTKGKFSFSFKKTTVPPITLDRPTVHQLCRVCTMYNLCTNTLKQISTELLVGLSCHGMLVSKMWYLSRGVFQCEVERVLKSLTSDDEEGALWKVILLFCQVALYLIAILDNKELYEECTYFSLSDLVEMSDFLNQLVFRLIWDHKATSPSHATLLTHAHSLLLLLHSRDSQKPFCPPDHWLLKELKVSSFISELKAKKPRAEQLLAEVPHIIPHRQRVEIFHDHVRNDRRSLGIADPHDHNARSPSTYITVQRGRILEDGFVQLSAISTNALKGNVKVKFVNEQGLEEAGIDERGVFKEFLEQAVKLAFDPQLNLFKASSDGHLYPSQTSHVQENHIALFEFVGKILGKAIYEGIVVDVPFALFFLSQLLERNNSVLLYSSLDELSSMDPDIYRSLSFIKHYEGDVTDLCLTFSWEEEFMGKMVTHELIYGGSGVPLTNDNRISYVHHMAHFRLYTQLKDQTLAFKRGFYSIVNKDWISYFSPPELQRLISGDQVDIDVDDLRKHTSYYGGYHDNHRVIVWLWDILKNDFTEKERSLFLKFVTSCSKPPLLGFAHLEPAFSIRFVDVADDDDRGDSIPSILRGLLVSRHHGDGQRLPTASTCFNLLKLPNYSKKSVLRDKLKYAISAGAGFELS